MRSSRSVLEKREERITSSYRWDRSTTLSRSKLPQKKLSDYLQNLILDPRMVIDSKCYNIEGSSAPETTLKSLTSYFPLSRNVFDGSLKFSF